MNMKKTAIAAALVSTMAVASTAAQADIITMNFSGLFSLGNASGDIQLNGDSTYEGGFRTQVSGTGYFDTATGQGSASIDPFSFFGGGLASATNTVFQAIGGVDASGNSMGPGTGSLVAGQMGFNWNGNQGIPVTLILDAAGFFASIQPVGSTWTVGANCTGCATSATADWAFFGQSGTIGAVPMAMTTYNTAGTTLGSIFPLSTDGIAGSPMTTAPFQGFNADFDFTSMTATNTGTVPVPAAVWLFGSGLVGLAGVARRRRS